MYGLSSHHRFGFQKKAGDGAFVWGLLLVLIAAIVISVAVPWH
jgi:hypothetical protein